MVQKNFLTLALLLCTCVSVLAQKTPAISQKETTRLIRTLRSSTAN